MLKAFFITLVLALTFSGASTAGAEKSKLRKVEAKVIDVGFCSPERESVCVKTDKGKMALLSPYSGAMDHASFNELFFLLHLVQGSKAVLIVENKDEIVGIDDPHFGMIASEIDMANNKLVPRKMP
jgi:hypothetical protein